MHEWRKFNYDQEPEIDGFQVGLFKPGIKSYLGRGWYWSAKLPGRIQTVGDIGCKIVSDWRVKSPDRDIEYLVKNPQYNYKWVNSSQGEDVENQILVSRRMEGGFWRVGRVIEGEFTYIAKIFPGGAHYENGDGREMMADNGYQILTCTPDDPNDIKDSEILILVSIVALLTTILIFILAYFGFLHRHKFSHNGVAFQKM